MSKDSKTDKSFPEKFKRLFRFERGSVPGNREIRLTEELRAELGSDSPTSTRMKAIKELNELLATKKLEEVSNKDNYYESNKGMRILYAARCSLVVLHVFGTNLVCLLMVQVWLSLEY